MVPDTNVGFARIKKSEEMYRLYGIAFASILKTIDRGECYYEKIIMFTFNNDVYIIDRLW